MVTVLSGVSTSLMIGGPEEDYIRMCSGLQQHHHQQQQHLVRNSNHNNPYSNGMAPSHRYNAKASAIVHRCQMKNIHMRSQSMPEDAYIKYNLQQQQIQQHSTQMYHNHALPQQQQQHLSQQQQNISKLEKRMSFANPTGGTSNVNLKRSQTNAADLGARLSAVQHFVNERQRFEASTNSLNTMAARSRSNIAALNWNFGETELYTSRVPNTSTNLSRATSFYHRDQMQSARSMGFLGPPPKDLSRPLHVDCSVEYDLGNQPRIPKNSAPLLIIHPAYQPQRFHPYASNIDFNRDLSLTSHYSGEAATSSPRWPSCRFTAGYHHNQQQQQQHQQLPKFDFEVTQSAPPKPQHRITRHSSFLVGGNVSSRQVSQFRPIVPEDESSFFNHQPYHQTRSFAPCTEASTMTELLESHHPVAGVTNNNYQSQHQMSNIIKRSKSIHNSSKGFHLSMPDLSLEENASHYQHLRKQQMALRNNGQHQHPKSRARTNLEAKLEAARKMSSESRDSGTSLDSHQSDVLNMMPSFIDEDDMLNDDTYSVASPPQKSDSGTGHPSQAFSDSGLGTPSSLMDQDAMDHGTSCSSSNSSSSSSVSKWKSSVSGGSQVVWRAFVSSLKCMHF